MADYEVITGIPGTASAVHGASPLYGSFARSYYPHIFGGRKDASFALQPIGSDTVETIVSCTIGDGVLDWWGFPAKVTFSSQPTRGAIDRLFHHLDRLKAYHELKTVVLSDIATGRLSMLGERCLSLKGQPELHLRGVADLTIPENDRHSAIRKSYKSLLSWGAKHLDIRAATTVDDFDIYQQLHYDVAGRSTRSQRTWDVMRDWCQNGWGELLLAFYQGEPAGGTMVIDGDQEAYYASGAYRRDLDLNLSHYPIWVAMQHAAARGKILFDFGDLPPFSGGEKEFQIGHFKKAFCTSIETRLQWRLK